MQQQTSPAHYGGACLLSRYNGGMKQLVRKPLLLAFLLSIPLWIVFDNYLVAGMAALLAAFLAAMCHALYTLGKKKRQ